MNNLILDLLIIVPGISFIVTYFIFKKYDSITNKDKESGYDISRKILNKKKEKDALIICKKGNLNDSYDVNREVIKLSNNTYSDDSMSAYIISTFITYQYLLEKNNKYIGKYKSFVDNILRFIIIGCYIGIVISLFCYDMSIFNFSIKVLFATLIYLSICLCFKIDVINEIKENEKKKYSNLFLVMLLFDYRIYISSILDIVNWLIEKIKEI